MSGIATDFVKHVPNVQGKEDGMSGRDVVRCGGSKFSCRRQLSSMQAKMVWHYFMMAAPIYLARLLVLNRPLKIGLVLSHLSVRSQSEGLLSCE